MTMIPKGYAAGELEQRHLWAEGLMSITVRARIEAFEPGQFVNLGLVVDDMFTYRAYSLASPPEAPPEFYVARIDEGGFTPALFQTAVGSTLYVEARAHGFFTLDYVPDARDLWCVATGTGLGPFLSILRAETAWRRFERIVVVHGAHAASHLGYRRTLAEIGEAHDGRLTYVPVVSRQSPPDCLQGRVTDAYARGALEARAGVALSPDTSHVMLCGNPGMISEMSELLAARGLNRHRVRKPGHVSIEKYW
jgi:ferredoxin--NADP+ reductase